MSSSLNSYRVALRHANLRRMLAAFTILELGAWSYTIVLAAYIYMETGSVAGIGAVAAVRWITGMLVTSFAGIAVDRYERRRLLTICSFIVTGIMVAMTVVVATGAPIWTILLLSGLNAAVESPNRPAAGALIPEVVEESDLTSANVLISLLENIVVVAGPLLGGLLLLLGNPALAVGINAATYAVAGVIYSTITVRSEGPTEEEGTSALSQWRTGLRALADRPYAIVLAACAMISAAVDGSYTVVFAELSEHLGLEQRGYSYFFAAAAAGGVLVAAIANRVVTQTQVATAVAICLATQGLSLVAISFVDSLASVILLLVATGAGTVLVDVLVVTTLQRIMPNRILGRTLATVTALLLLSASAAAIGLGQAIETVGLERTILATGVVVPILGVAALPLLLRGDQPGVEPLEADAMA